MKRVKDFIYNWNDIIVVLLIILCAVLLINWRIGVIMDYPKAMAESLTPSGEEPQEEPGGAEEPGTEDPEDPEDPEEPEEPEEPDGPADSTVWKDGKLRAKMEVEVPLSNNAYDAVEYLVEIGLFQSYEEYEKVCESEGVDPFGIMAGEYVFDAGSTQADIIHEVVY